MEKDYGPSVGAHRFLRVRRRTGQRRRHRLLLEVYNASLSNMGGARCSPQVFNYAYGDNDIRWSLGRQGRAGDLADILEEASGDPSTTC